MALRIEQKRFSTPEQEYGAEALRELQHILKLYADGCFIDDFNIDRLRKVGFVLPPNTPKSVPTSVAFERALKEVHQPGFKFSEFARSALPPNRIRSIEELNPGLVSQSEDFLDLLESREAYRRNLALILLRWFESSKRVLYLPDDTQFLLEHTSTSRMKWQDVHLPFRGFALKTERPFSTDELVDRSVSYDLLMVADISADEALQADLPYGREKGAILFQVVSPDVMKSPTLDVVSKRMITQQMRVSGRSNEYERWNAKRKNLASVGVTVYLDKKELEGRLLTDDVIKSAIARSAVDASIGDVTVFNKGFRLFASTCFYLSMMGQDRKIPENRKKWAPIREASGGSGALSGQLFDVFNTVPISREEMEELRQAVTGGSVSPHFRTGHMRTIDEEAGLRTFVRPTIVRPDRIKPGQVLSPTVKTVK